MLSDNLSRDSSGELCLGGVGLSRMAEKYGTPLYLYDEDRIRSRCREYKSAMLDSFGVRSRVLYASKAASFKRIY